MLVSWNNWGFFHGKSLRTILARDAKESPVIKNFLQKSVFNWVSKEELCPSSSLATLSLKKVDKRASLS